MTGHGPPVEDGWDASGICSKEGEGNVLDKKIHLSFRVRRQRSEAVTCTSLCHYMYLDNSFHLSRPRGSHGDVTDLIIDTPPHKA